MVTDLIFQREKEPEPISKEARDSQIDPTLPVSSQSSGVDMVMPTLNAGEKTWQRAFEGSQD